MSARKDSTWRCLLVLSLVTLWLPSVEAQTKLKPGFNIFSPEQDVEIGKQSAAEVERQFPVLKDSEVQTYVSRIGERLAGVAPGPKFPYQFKVVNVSDVNAFALPGGFMYINRGLVEAAHDEAELAGVMAHEMSHVALRHGTNQASKAYLGQAGLGILGGVLGGGTTADIMGAIGGFGMNSLFLKFSRSAEEQADVSAAQMLAKAGYDPMAMARMFETLREQAGRDPSRLEQFFSSHPAPAERVQRIQKETNLIGGYESRSPVGNFSRIQTKLERMPKAPSMEQLAKNQPGATGKGQPTEEEDSGPVRVSVEQPSSRMQTFEQKNGAFRVRFPDNWEAREASTGEGVTLTPGGGVVSRRGEESIVYGAIISTFDPAANNSRSRSTSRVSLESATEALLAQIVQSNSYLKREGNAARRVSVDGGRGLTVSLSGISPVTELQERVVLVTRLLDDNRLIYLLFISPERDYQNFQPTFDDIASSFRVGG